MPKPLLRLTFYALFVALLFCSRPASVHADCACSGGELEIVFILDCSSSMNHTLATLQEQIVRLMEAMQGRIRHLRAAVVVFRTSEYAGKQKKLEVFPFNSDGRAVADYLRSQSAEGGGEEIVDKALNAALEDLKWTKGARKVAVLLGDEQGNESMQARCLLSAGAMKDRGIVLNTVTASQTAWIYWSPPNAGTWKQQLAGMGEEAKRTFKLPGYTALAETTGGISVSSWNSKELVLWLLAFGLGLNDKEAKDKIDVDKYLEWAKQRDQADAEAEKAALDKPGATATTPLLACLRHGGEWRVPHRAESLLEHLANRIELNGALRVPAISATDEALERCPVLYLSGHGAVKWTKPEREALKSWLSRGGFLITDACCGDAEFSKSLKEILAELFPGQPLEKLPATHPLFACGHQLEQVRRSEAPRTGKLETVVPELLGLHLPETGTAGAGKPRLAVVFSPHDLGCAWHTRPLGVPCQHHDEDGLRLGANMLLWALTR